MAVALGRDVSAAPWGVGAWVRSGVNGPEVLEFGGRRERLGAGPIRLYVTCQSGGFYRSDGEYSPYSFHRDIPVIQPNKINI